ncbi:MAG: reverse transcriptase domain-containing protein, partial [Gloeomargaritales cyanobacterium]
MHSFRAAPIVDGENLPTFETTNSPFYKLISLFEALISGPSGPTEKGNWDKLIDSRLQAFRSAKIKPMFDRAQLIRISPPQDRAQLPNHHQREQAATIFANLDNPGKALRIITVMQPLALATPPVVKVLQGLFPSECSFSPPERSSRSASASAKELYQSADPFIIKQIFDADNIRDSLRRVKKGSAAGGLTDSTDMFTALFLSQLDDTAHDISDANITIFSSLIAQILEGNLPPDASGFFNASRLIALRKDPDNELKIRPIAIGTALRRLICGHISRVHRPYFAKFLSPYQWGIGIPNGMDFVYHTTSRLLQKYVARTQEEMWINPPSRALVQLDLKNMFNSVSRKKARQMISDNFPHLIGVFDLMYKIPAEIWYQLPKGEWQHLLQLEGFPQGCPLSSFFSALILHCILTKLDAELRQRAATRYNKNDKGDDGFGSSTDIFAFLDDTQTVVPYKDLLFLFRRFTELGAPLGCVLAQGKCTIMTATSCVSPKEFLSADNRNDLEEALNNFCGGPSGELLQGTRLLGYPLGKSTYVKIALQKAVNDLTATTTTLNNTISDPQIKFILFKTCIQPRIGHLELSDMLQDPQGIMAPTEFTITSLNTTRSFLSTLLHGENSNHHLSQLSLLQAIQPVGNGGLGLRSTQDSRIGRYLTSTIRAFRHSKDDIALPTPTDDEHPPLTICLPSSIKHLYHPWRTTSPLLVTIINEFQCHLHHLPQYKDIPIPDLPDYITGQDRLTSLSRTIYRHQVATKLQTHVKSLPMKNRIALDSLQNHLATVPLAHLTRRIPSNRLPPADFRTLLGISICDDIFDGPLPTRCFCDNANFDPTEHHYFSCAEIHKTHAHDLVRDAIRTIFKEITPYVPSIGDAIICKEKRGYHRTATRLRPGDVSIHYGESKTNTYSALLVDVTTLGFSSPPHHDVSQPVTNIVTQHHVAKENEKFRGGRGYAGGSTFISGEDVISSLNHQNLKVSYKNHVNFVPRIFVQISCRALIYTIPASHLFV